MARRKDRRDSFDEKEQKEIIRNVCKNISEEYSIDLNLEDFDTISKGQGKEGKYFSKDGKILPVSIKRNHCKDSKAIDGVSYFRKKDTDNYVEIYFFCKFTKEKGGNQDYIPFEIEVTRNCIEKNSNERVVVIFMLEGGYWEPSIIEDCDFDNKKTIYANRDNIKETLKKILETNNLI